MGSQEKVTVGSLRLGFSTPKSITVMAKGAKDYERLPKSLIEYPLDAARGEEIEVTMPQWLADEKDFDYDH